MKLKVGFEGMDKVVTQTSRKPKSFWQEKNKACITALERKIDKLL